MTSPTPETRWTEAEIRFAAATLRIAVNNPEGDPEFAEWLRPGFLTEEVAPMLEAFAALSSRCSPKEPTGLPEGMEEFAFACLTGDCPHETQAECDAWVRAELIETTRENSRLHTEKAQLEGRCSQLEADATKTVAEMHDEAMLCSERGDYHTALLLELRATTQAVEKNVSWATVAILLKSGKNLAETWNERRVFERGKAGAELLAARLSGTSET